MKKQLFFTFLLISIMTTASYAQKADVSWFSTDTILAPTAADIRSTVPKMEAIFIKDLSPYYYLNDSIDTPMIEVHLSNSFPIVSFSKNNLNFSASMPVGFTVLVDLFEETTAPVINTDYWFGTQLKAQYNFTNKAYLKNVGVIWKPLFHESTHIGDEFSIHGYAQIPDFKRVNISFEATELAFVVNNRNMSDKQFLSARVGLQYLLSSKDGYFLTDSLETKGVEIQPSEDLTEWYFQFEGQADKGFWAGKRLKPYFSTELRNRTVLSYDSSVPETRQWSVNAVAGWRIMPKKTQLHTLLIYGRYYKGVNPHGQFRNTADFSTFSFGLALI